VVLTLLLLQVAGQRRQAVRQVESEVLLVAHGRRTLALRNALSSECCLQLAFIDKVITIDFEDRLDGVRHRQTLVTAFIDLHLIETLRISLKNERSLG